MVKLIPGLKIGRLTVLEKTGRKTYPGGQSVSLWECQCECGNRTVVDSSNLCGKTKSCGCLVKEKVSQAATIHGYSTRRASKQQKVILQAWYSMRNRCYRKEDISYPYYGGRGIKVLWPDFESFLADMEATWKPGLSVERNDVNGHYCKENCRWATRHEQHRNTRRNRFFTIKGITGCVKDLCRHFKISERTVYWRLDSYGWSPEDAFLKPVGQCYGPRKKESLSAI